MVGAQCMLVILFFKYSSISIHIQLKMLPLKTRILSIFVCFLLSLCRVQCLARNRHSHFVVVIDGRLMPCGRLY